MIFGFSKGQAVYIMEALELDMLLGDAVSFTI